MGTVAFKLVGAERHMSPFSKGDPTVRGGTIEVPEEKADIFRNETWVDHRTNEEMPMWKELADGESAEAESAEGEAEAKKPVAPAKKPRTPRAA